METKTPAITVLFIILVPQLAQAAIFSVCPTGGGALPAGCNYFNIQNAINNATTGDTVAIRAGTYNETLELNVSYFNLTGNASWGSVIINGTNTNRLAALNVTANYSNVSNLTLTSGFHGVYVGPDVTRRGGNWSVFNNILVTNMTTAAAVDNYGFAVGHNVIGVNATNLQVDNLSNTGGRIPVGIFLFGGSNFGNYTNVTVSNISASSVRADGILIRSSNHNFYGNLTIYNVSLINAAAADVDVMGLTFDSFADIGETPNPSHLNFYADTNITLVQAMPGDDGVAAGLNLQEDNLDISADNITFLGRVYVNNVTSLRAVSAGDDHAMGISIGDVSVTNIRFLGDVIVNNISSGEHAVGIQLWPGVVANNVSFAGSVLVSNVSGNAASGNYGARLLVGTSVVTGAITVMNITNTAGNSMGFEVWTASNTLSHIRSDGISTTGGIAYGVGIETTNEYLPSLFVGNITGSNGGIGVWLDTTTNGITINNLTTAGVIRSADVFVDTSAGTNTIGNGSFRSTANNSINFTAFTGTFNTTNVSYNVSNVSYTGASTGTFSAFWWLNITVQDRDNSLKISGATVTVNNSSSTNQATLTSAVDGTTSSLLLRGVTITAAATTNSYPYNVTATKSSYDGATNTLSLVDANATIVRLRGQQSYILFPPPVTGDDGGGGGGGRGGVVEPCTGLCLPPDQPYDPQTRIETIVDQGFTTGGGLSKFACYLPTLPPPSSEVYAFVDARNSTTNRTQCNWQLRFNVPNDWLEQAGITPENVTLMVLDGNDWKQVYTENISSDENNTYYRAFAPKINGVFAIASRTAEEGAELVGLQGAGTGTGVVGIGGLSVKRFGILSQSMPELLLVGLFAAVACYMYVGDLRRFA
ncbi:PGF-pre-PGF domain-containing protein [Candidatus Micrarchaeota archaeon]|nr:PGF-pre-PGF domain-containing protein [Candidatus Micrarchaeota archaeon]